MNGRPRTFPVPFLRRAACVLAAALAAALPGWAGIDVQVEGHKAFRTRVLKETVPPDPEEYNEEELGFWREDALFNLEDLYRRSGYFESKVSVELRRKEGKDSSHWIADVRVADGPRYLFDSVRVLVSLGAPDSRAGSPSAAGTRAGAGVGTEIGSEDGSAIPIVSDTAMAKADSLPMGSPEDVGVELEEDDVEAKAGEPFEQTLLFQDRRSLLRRFGNAGYVRAQVQERVSLRTETRTVKVDYLVEPSYPVVFDTLLIHDRRPPPADSSPGITKEDLLRSLVPYKRGDTVSIGRNDQLIEKLQYTGAFNFVRLKDSLIEGGEGRSALMLQAEERVPGSMRGSVYYETQYGAGVSLDARHTNIGGNLNELRAGGEIATQRQAVYGGYGSPLTFGRLLRFDEDLNSTWFQGLPSVAEFGLFDGNFLAESNTRFTYPWSYWLNLSANGQIQGKSRVTDSAARDRFLNLNFIQTAALAFLNQTMDPTRGLRLMFTWGNGGPLFRQGDPRFGEDRHNWLEGRTAQYYYYPPLRQFKLATRLDGGRFFGDGAANSELFFLGGSRSVRSYNYQSLCPVESEEGVCLSNNQTLAYYLVSAELRMELFAMDWVPNRGPLKFLVPLQVVPFADYGRVWDVSDRESGDTRPEVANGYALGLGTRYPLLGVFNLRLDFVLNGSGSHWFWLDLAQAF